MGHGHVIAFLERNSLNATDVKSFTPADFVEMQFDSRTSSDLLTATCHLNQVSPLQSTSTDMCPAVSTAAHCAAMDKSRISLHVDGSNSSGVTAILIPGEASGDIDIIRSKSGTIQIKDDRSEGLRSIRLDCLLIATALLFLCSN